MRITKPTKLASLGRAAAVKPLALVFTLVLASLAFAAAPALAAGEPHPVIEHTGFETDTFSNPNGIAVDESTGDVYVAAIGTNSVYKFNAKGEPVDFNFPAGSKEALGNTLRGADTPAESFSFPSVYGTPAAIAVDNSLSPSDPSAGDLYVMDAGHGVIDKFNSEGKYLSQITGFGAATGSAERELLGIAVDSAGSLRATVARLPVVGAAESLPSVAIDVFDDSAANHLIAEQVNEQGGTLGGLHDLLQSDGFAVGPTGDNYLLYEGCSCMVRFGQKLSPLGLIDDGGSGDVALATDPATGHVYADAQSSVAEWDTGAMDHGGKGTSQLQEGVGTLVSRFGSSQLLGSSGQGGIAVNGASGEIYVSNPADGKVYVFGSDAPAVTVGSATAVAKEAATLHGTVDPRASAVATCEFEYGIVNEFGQGSYEDSVPCAQTPVEIDAGSSAAPVSAEVVGLQAGQLYHFRLTAVNASGSSLSSGLVATLGVGFGIKTFEVSFLNEDGSPDTQAGSHPYQMVVNFTVNSHYQRMESDADSPYIREPGGTLKDLAVDLPPGLVGDPNATAKKCTLLELRSESEGSGSAGGGCPHQSIVGFEHLSWSEQTPYASEWEKSLANMVPPRGVALQLGTNFVLPLLFVNNDVQAGGDYPIQSTIVNAPPAAPLLTSRVTISGVVGEGTTRKPFLTLPTGCHGPLHSSIEVDSYQEPSVKVKKEEVTRNSAGTPVSLTGCSKLLFPPTISVSPDTTNASSSSGLTVGVHVPQTAAHNPEGLAESGLRNTTVALPSGVALNPSGANGLEACSAGLASFEGFKEFNKGAEPGVQTATFNPDALEGLLPGVSLCPNGSKIGEVTIHTPLLPDPLKGFVYLASQEANPFGSLVAMYMMVEDPISGSTIKLTGEVQLCEGAGQVIEGVSCQGQGQIITTFKNTPDLPFEELELHFFGGERAPLSTPSRCGTYTTTAIFTPWDGNAPVTSTSSFQIEHGPAGGPCPGASLPFNPSVTGGATNIQAGAFSPLTVTVNRKDGEQNLKSLVAKLPPGLSGVLSGVELCPEPRANEGLCGEASKVGEATISVGVGNQPFTVTGGKFYLTGPYNGTGACTVGEAGCAPFGLTFEVPAKAGPFDLENTKSNHPPCDCVVVRGKIELNPITSAITITSNPPGSTYSIPTSIEGIPLEIQHINATTTRGDFQFNPTNCEKMSLEGTVQLNEGGTSTITTPFQVTNCAALKFEPKFSVSTSAKTSRTDGASLTAKLTYPNVPQGTDADIARVKVELPKQLPSRLTTLQKACSATQFEANPAGCPAASKIGYATVHTPLIPVPLQGPAIFVSHGGEAFPSLTLVLQGYGITIDLVGTTDIKKGVTSTTFKTVPDQPFSSFELTLPEGPYSALTTAGNLCTAKNLTMPTEFIAQNGAELHQATKIEVQGCGKAKKAHHQRKKHNRKKKTKRRKKK